VILGNVQGNVDASDRLEVRKDAWVVGDITTARIMIEDGAYFKGSIDIVKPEPAKPNDSLEPKPQVTAFAAAAATSTNSQSALWQSEF
jgi:cytoskeletal protein CcmA (bactofilin family)